MKTCWVFDIDGVITDLETKKPNEEVVSHIAKLLEKDIVCFNTGRSFSWVEENLVSRLKNTVPPAHLSSVFFAFEQGGGWAEFENGAQKQEYDKNLLISNEFIEPIKTLVRKTKTMFFDDTKKTMVTIEMKDDTDRNIFKGEYEEILPKIEQIVDRINPQLKITPGAIAVDIMNRFEGKNLGMLRLLEFFEREKITPERCVCFGDSPADLEMADELTLAKIPVEFVYVGTDELIQTSYTVHKTSEKYSLGTLEFLKTIN